MARKQDLRIGPCDRVQRVEALVGRDVQGGGNHLGADAARDGVARAERVADEQDALAPEVDRAVTGGVTGSGDHAGAARRREDVIAGEGLGFLERGRVGVLCGGRCVR